MSDPEVEWAINELIRQAKFYLNLLSDRKLFLTHHIFQNHIEWRLEDIKKIDCSYRRYRVIFDTLYYTCQEICKIVNDARVEFQFNHPNPEIVDNIYQHIQEGMSAIKLE